MAPTVNEVENEWKDKVSFVIFDLRHNPYRTIAGEKKIRSIPTMHFYKDGKKTGTLVGAYPKDAIVKELEKIK